MFKNVIRFLILQIQIDAYRKGNVSKGAIAGKVNLSYIFLSYSIVSSLNHINYIFYCHLYEFNK